jgi:hypothetical protein
MSINSFEWWHPIQGFSEELDIPELAIEDGSDYKVNSYNYRCDEFRTNHKGKHILFSGCSYTFGIGLLKEETWAYDVYKKINESEVCSGYFNLGIKGNSINNSILNIFKYCKQFGNPDVIFINLPESKRFFDFDEKEYKYRITYHNSNDRIFKINILVNYNNYLMLEQYCKNNNIKLFSFTYDIHQTKNLRSTNELFKDFNFKSFYYTEYNKMLKELFLLKKNNNGKFFDFARDAIPHRGTGWNIWWSNFIYNKYLESV